MIGDGKVKSLNDASHAIWESVVLTESHAETRRDRLMRGLEQRSHVLKTKGRLALNAQFKSFDVAAQWLGTIWVPSMRALSIWSA
ncbi:MAG: hypothetical protein ABSA90_06615 [Xanthobacteraceae bacterium]|jgi:hypothetical protein